MPSSLHLDSLPMATPTPYGPSSWMMATLMSLASLPSLALAFSAMKEQEASPNWSEWTCGRNTYCRFLSLNTAEAMQTLAHMNFLAASTLAAIGTQWALE